MSGDRKLANHNPHRITTRSTPSSGKVTNMCVLAHLFCYAIGEEYVAKHLSDYALAKFDEALRAITPKDFASLVGVIASQEEVGGDSGHRRRGSASNDGALRLRGWPTTKISSPKSTWSYNTNE
jgi:hypothetical protein